MSWVRRLTAAALMLVALGIAAAAMAAPDFEKMSENDLRKYAAEHQIDLGAANSKKTMIAVIQEGLAAQETVGTKGAGSLAAQGRGDFKPPPPDWFKPKIPDLSDATVPGRVANVFRLILGGFGVALLGYALWRLLQLASQALAGKKTNKQLIDEGVVLIAAFALILLVLGGMMYAFLAAVLEFFMSQT